MRSDKVTCPVAVTEKLSALLPQSHSPLPLVRRIVKCKSKEYFHESFSTIRDDLRSFLRPFVVDVGLFGLHSIKSGAASDPACRFLGNDLIDRHAGWRNSASKYRYIKYSTQDLQTVSSSLGI